MFLFKRNRVKEEDIQAVRRDTFKKIDKSSKSIDKFSKSLDNSKLGITGAIFYATGGDRRK